MHAWRDRLTIIAGKFHQRGGAIKKLDNHAKRPAQQYQVRTVGQQRDNDEQVWAARFNTCDHVHLNIQPDTNLGK